MTQNISEPTTGEYEAINFDGLEHGDKAQCYNLRQHIIASERRNLPATLTIEQWCTTVNYFRGKCAYCQVRDFEVLEHFIPHRHGGGTTADNCVPACRICNGLKSSHLPSDIPRSSRYRQIRWSILRVQEYLTTCGSEATAAS